MPNIFTVDTQCSHALQSSCNAAAGQGSCNTASGTCDCNVGWTGDDCNTGIFWFKLHNFDF